MKSKITEILILAGILVLVFLLILQINDKPQQEKIFIRDTVEKISEKIIYKTAKPKKVVLYKRDTLFRTDIMRVEKSGGSLKIFSVVNDTTIKSEEFKTYGNFKVYSDTNGVTLKNQVMSFDGIYLSTGAEKNFGTGKMKHHIGAGLSANLYGINLSVDFKYFPVQKDYILEAEGRIYFR
jgi:hypothetical protein